MRADAACTGRACVALNTAQEVTLARLRGATRAELTVAPMNAGAFAAPGAARYGHIRMAGGQPAWQTIEARQGTAAAGMAPVALVDRHGAPLWRDSTPSAAAVAEGLAPLLGYRRRPGQQRSRHARSPWGKKFA